MTTMTNKIEFPGWIECSEAEAVELLARRAKNNVTWPRYFRGDKWSDTDGFVRYDSADREGVYVFSDGTERIAYGDRIATVQQSIEEHGWREITATEALARITKVTTPAQLETALQAWTAACHTIAAMAEPPAEAWPKWYTLNPSMEFPFNPWCIKRLSATEGIRFDLIDGKQSQEEVKFNYVAESWIEVTEAEALALVTPVEPYPHYYAALSVSMAYARRDTEHTATIVRIDGREYPDSWYSTTHEGRTRITEAEALARVNPVEPSDDWVEITDPEHVLRKGIDEGKYFGGSEHWWKVDVSKGGKAGDHPLATFRCRRKDLPVKPVKVEKLKQIPMRLWAHRDCRNDDRYNVFVKMTEPLEAGLYLEIKHNDGGWYVEVPDEN